MLRFYSAYCGLLYVSLAPETNAEIANSKPYPQMAESLTLWDWQHVHVYFTLLPKTSKWRYACSRAHHNGWHCAVFW